MLQRSAIRTAPLPLSRTGHRIIIGNRRPSATEVDKPLTSLASSPADAATHDQCFRRGAEGAGIGGWDPDLSTRELFWSNTARKLFGVSDSAPVTHDLFLSLLEPDDRERAKQTISGSVEPGASFDLACRLKREDGRSHWVRARGSLIRDKDGTPLRLAGVVLDIDGEKRLEEDLLTREGHLQSILETIPDAMIVIDGRAIMQFFSSATERQFGYHEQEAIGRNVSMLMPELIASNRPVDYGMVEVSVFDTGHGFPADVGKNLFKTFFTTKETGMGVGLSISRSIIEAHGGRMWAESNEARGATFRFTLPAVHDESLTDGT
ncbi:PAS domain S-box protein [Bradyrhizobium sp. BRP22]|uniref:PAS domain S-box protein n=1 Tax=Bradyrhizobium sp. BRP22 TaxID=2793821 RepID=UPI001CD2BA9D|nr:PAS domain S-box protein [Bradyrhizobium sp. BRP22]MCA1456053.1 PAS domain S-box protein [Bradyrhizobium sp. BRP22]